MDEAKEGRSTVVCTTHRRHAAGSPQAVLAACARDVDAAPESADAWYNLGKALSDQHRDADSVRAYQKAAEIRPADPEIWYNLANALVREKRLTEAVQAYRKGIASGPSAAPLHANLGHALAALGRLDEAIGIYLQAVRLDPSDAHAYGGLGEVLTRRGRYTEAYRACTAAVALAPESAEAAFNLGTLAWLMHRWSDAERALRRAIALRSDFAEAMVNLAGVVQEQGRSGEALVLLRNAVGVRPAMAEAHYNLALALLQSGAEQEGWKEFEWRHAAAGRMPDPARTPHPAWDGVVRSGMTLLVREEQGYGDTIQFARFLDLLAARGMRVIFECRRELHPLFQAKGNLSGLVIPGEDVSGVDAETHLLSVPYHCNLTSASMPNNVPYIDIAPACRARWSARVHSTAADLHVGIVWKGNPEHRNDRNRSIPLHELIPLLELPGVMWHTLRPECDPKSARLFTSRSRVCHHGECLTDFGETAGLIGALDLLITVDTAAAHLAGAVAAPVWILLPRNPDWRWLLDRTDSPWYPTATLFRQPEQGAWGPVVQAVRGALAQAVNGKRRGGSTR